MSSFRRSSSMCALSVVSLTSLAACGTTVIEAGTSSGLGTGGYSEGPPIPRGAGGSSIGTASGGTGGASGFSSGQVSTALATCSLAHGPAVAAPTVDAVSASLLGTWATCPSSTTSQTTPMTPGIAIYPGGTFATLVSDGAGGLVAGQGVTSTGQWWVDCETDGSIPDDSPCGWIVVRLQTSSGDTSLTGCFGGPASFESSPSRMITESSPQEWCDPGASPGPIASWLVPLM